MATNIQEVDSLVANEFAVEIDGTEVQGIFSVEGLTLFQLDDDGNRVKPALIITKMVQRDSSLPFNQWHKETVESRDGDTRPTRSIAVVAIDDGIETRRWTLKDAYITGISYSNYDAGSSEMIEETYTIAYNDIEEAWTFADSDD